MNNTSSETFIQEYIMQKKYRDTTPELPERYYNFDGSDYWRKTIDILGLSVWGDWTFEGNYTDEYMNQDFGVEKLQMGQSQGFIKMPERYYDEIMPNVTKNHNCTSYGDNTICDCDLSNLDSYPTLQLKIG